MEEIQTRVKFLHEASNILAPKGEVRKLSCHLRYLREKFSEYGKWTVPTDKNLLPSTCPQCFVEFQGTPYSIIVKPSPKPSRNLVRVLQKKAKFQQLSRVETVLLNNFENNRGKKLVLKCGVCQKETERTLVKQKADYKKNTANTTNGLPIKNKQNPKNSCNISFTPTMANSTNHHVKKKKKKDQYAGLKVSAVKSFLSKKKVK